MAGNYNGQRLLLDAKNSRQYAVTFVHGNVTQVRVFAEKDSEKGLVPGETVLAFDYTHLTDPKHKKIERQTKTSAKFTTVLFRFDVKSDGRFDKIGYSPVEYVATYATDAKGEPIIRFDLTPESTADLLKEGLSTANIESFEAPVDKFLTGDDIATVLQTVDFPPHHPEGAFLAEQEVAPKPQIPVIEDFMKRPKPDGVVAPKPVANKPSAQTQRPTQPFNQNSAPTKKYRVPESTIEALIKQYCRDLTSLAENGELDPVVGREKETDQALKVLMRRKQSSLCFTGDAGVGKSAMFAAVAQRLVEDPNLPQSLLGARVLELDLQAMNAGAKFRGQFEEKLKPLIDGLQEREGILNGRKIIIAIDEIHSQLTAGKAEGGTDSGNMMKPFLQSKGISVMGTTTDEEYKKHIEKDGALNRRFERARLLPPSDEAVVHIMKTLWPMVKAHNHLTEDMSDEDIRYLAAMSNRYAPQEAQPSKSEKVLNMAAASAEFEGRSVIQRSDLIAAIAQMANLPVEFLAQSDAERFVRLQTELPNDVLGQPGLGRLTDNLVGARAGLTDENQPWACFVLQGPTGTGKTETAKALARHLFGTEDALIKLDMSKYMEKHAVAGLIGAPPGYVGFEDAKPALTERVRQRPYSVLLLDEIEKAHPDAFNILLSILNDGKIDDNQGRTVLFNNVIILMTTNIGAKQAMKVLTSGGVEKGIGFNGAGAKKLAPEELMGRLEEVYKKAIVTPREDKPALFQPEMLNRIEELGGFVTFIPLEKQVITNLVDREIGKVQRRLNDQTGANIKGLTIEVTPEVKTQLADQGYNPLMGARPLRKVVREKIANRIGAWLLANKEEILSFIAKNGGAKIVIDSLERSFVPELVAITPPVEVANDNAAATAAAKKPARKKTPKIGL